MLVIFHGQAIVDCGFSVNKELEVENLQEDYVTVQRLICDHVDRVGGIANVNITTPILTSAASARQKYMAYLDDWRRLKEDKSISKKRQDKMNGLDDVKKRRKHIETDIVALVKSTDEFSEKAETTRKVDILINKCRGNSWKPFMWKCMNHTHTQTHTHTHTHRERERERERQRDQLSS